MRAIRCSSRLVDDCSSVVIPRLQLSSAVVPCLQLRRRPLLTAYLRSRWTNGDDEVTRKKSLYMVPTTKFAACSISSRWLKLILQWSKNSGHLVPAYYPQVPHRRQGRSIIVFAVYHHLSKLC